MKSTTNRICLGIGLEYPLALRGGVSVLVESLINKLAGEFRIVLVSPDCSQSIGLHPLRPKISHHIRCAPPVNAPSPAYGSIRDNLIAELVQQNVSCLLLHCGGVYGWGNRWPGASVARAAHRNKMRVLWANHLVVSPLDGYCGKNKAFWLKLAMFPFAWLGKLGQMAAVQREIAVSDHDLKKLQRWYFPASKKLLRIYHSRLSNNLHRPSPSAARKQIVLSVGHVAFRKGQHILADSFARVAPAFPDWQLWIAGSDGGDGCWEAIEQVRIRHGLEQRIRLLGEQSDAQSLLQMAAIFVQPSLQEALGLALQEALAAGCACIGTEAGGIPELIDHAKNGLLVPMDHPAQMANALQILMQSPRMRQELSATAPASLATRGMSEHDMIESYRALIHGHTD